jgi:hypothetical protein
MFCPQCGDGVDVGAVKCGRCPAKFDRPGGWKPVSVQPKSLPLLLGLAIAIPVALFGVLLAFFGLALARPAPEIGGALLASAVVCFVVATGVLFSPNPWRYALPGLALIGLGLLISNMQSPFTK